MARQTDRERLRYLATQHGRKRHQHCDLCFLMDLIEQQDHAINRILRSGVRISREEH